MMSEVFHKYDVRGRYPKDLDDVTAYRLAGAITMYFSIDKVVIGRDYRMSSPSLFENIVRGFNDAGVSVTYIGETATPVLYRECILGEFPVGVMITASHNPKEDNGFKICTPDGKLITKGKGLEKIEALVDDDEGKPGNSQPIYEFKDPLDSYVSHIGDMLTKIQTKFKVVIDTGNGVAGPILHRLMEHYSGEVSKLFFEPDGNYPNHPANPLVEENLESLKRTVKEKDADVGFAFDGDGDRCIVIDEMGETINTDMLLCLIARMEGKDHPGAKIYYDLRFSRVVREEIEKWSCKPKVSEVGNAVYKEKLADKGGLLAAELSGHVMYAENHNIDDGFYLMAKVLTYMDRLQQPLSEVIAPYKKYFQTPEINIKTKDPTRVIDTIKDAYEGHEIEELDGITVYGEGWWFNIRKSNTEPLVRLRLEADEKGTLDQIRHEVENYIHGLDIQGGSA